MSLSCRAPPGIAHLVPPAILELELDLVPSPPSFSFSSFAPPSPARGIFARHCRAAHRLFDNSIRPHSCDRGDSRRDKTNPRIVTSQRPRFSGCVERFPSARAQSLQTKPMLRANLRDGGTESNSQNWWKRADDGPLMRTVPFAFALATLQCERTASFDYSLHTPKHHNEPASATKHTPRCSGVRRARALSPARNPFKRTQSQGRTPQLRKRTQIPKRNDARTDLLSPPPYRLAMPHAAATQSVQTNQSSGRNPQLRKRT